MASPRAKRADELAPVYWATSSRAQLQRANFRLRLLITLVSPYLASGLVFGGATEKPKASLKAAEG